jgi:hypothetical protein
VKEIDRKVVNSLRHHSRSVSIRGNKSAFRTGRKPELSQQISFQICLVLREEKDENCGHASKDQKIDCLSLESVFGHING